MRKVIDATLLVGAFVFLVAYAAPIVWPQIDPWLAELCDAAQLTVWIVFAIDLIGRLLSARDRRQFLRRNWLDVLAVIAPLFRPLRVLRLISVAELAASRFGRSMGLRTSIGIRTAVTATLLWLVAGLAVTDAERDMGGPIQSAADGWWWALTTMTTVGYGDFYPVTAQGRFVGAGLMVLGITILGITTAALASWFVEKVEEAEEASTQELAEIIRLRQEVELLREELRAFSKGKSETDGRQSG